MCPVMNWHSVWGLPQPGAQCFVGYPLSGYKQDLGFVAVQEFIFHRIMTFPLILAGNFSRKVYFDICQVRTLSLYPTLVLKLVSFKLLQQKSVYLGTLSRTY